MHGVLNTQTQVSFCHRVLDPPPAFALTTSPRGCSKSPEGPCRPNSYVTLEISLSNPGPWTGCSSSTCELVRSAASQAHLGPLSGSQNGNQLPEGSRAQDSWEKRRPKGHCRTRRTVGAGGGCRGTAGAEGSGTGSTWVRLCCEGCQASRAAGRLSYRPWAVRAVQGGGQGRTAPPAALPPLTADTHCPGTPLSPPACCVRVSGTAGTSLCESCPGGRSSLSLTCPEQVEPLRPPKASAFPRA